MTLIETSNHQQQKKRSMKKRYLLLLLISLPFLGNSQCQVGETEVVLSLVTDAWGYEAYWEIVPSGNSCGEGVIAFGGNPDQVGCDGGGDQDATGGNGYANNSTILSDPICLITGNSYDIHYIDDFIDGGLDFSLLQDGVLSYLFNGAGDNVFTFVVGESGIEPADLPCIALVVEADGEAVSYNNENATVSPNEPSPDGGGCATTGLWCEGGISNTLWATFQPVAEQSYQITTCIEGTEFDTQLALYSSSDCTTFDDFILVSTNDDGGCGVANGFSSTMYTSCLDSELQYYIQIDGYNGETGNGMIQITSIEPDTELIANVNNVSCPLDKLEPGDGDITLQLSNSGSDYSCLWTGPNGFTSEDQWLQDIDPGSYEVVVTDACGTAYFGSYEIEQPDAINVSYSVVSPACPLSADGSISASVTGGTEPYEIIWSGPELFTSNGQQIDELNEGEYVVIMSDDNDCQYNNTLNLTSINEIDLNIGADTTICNNQDLVISGPLGYNYEWQDGSTNQFFILEGEEIGEGQFSVILNIENDFGCNTFDAVVVTVEACVGVEENQDFSFSLVPNPVADVLIVSSNQSGGQVSIYNAVGKLVLKKQLQGIQNQIDLSTLANGFYMVQLMNGQSAGAEQILIQH